MQNVAVLDRNFLSLRLQPFQIESSLPAVSVPERRPTRISAISPVFHAQNLEELQAEEERKRKEEEARRKEREAMIASRQQVYHTD